MSQCDIERFIRSGARGHLVGVGGVSMSPLAELLHGTGVPVTGSDMSDSPAVRRLERLGVGVYIGHAAENVRGAGYIIRTAAAREDNVEIKAARELGIPVFERAEAWGYIMRGYRDAVCVYGTHGKTTTTSMLTQILLAAGADPTVMIGGTLPTLGSGYHVGHGDVIVLESCEYYNSFHSFFPTIAIILNIDADHLDFFRDLDDVKQSFRTFAALTPESGTIIAGADDENTLDALAPLGRELMTFGISETARVRGITDESNGSVIVTLDGEPFCEFRLRVPGLHNIRNALAAVAAAITLGIGADAIAAGLTAFTGAGRRFEYKGSINGADVYDDYAHHPTELRNLLDAVEGLHYERVILAFQPHTYTRTKALFNDFAAELSRADIPYLAEIFAARKKNEVGISSLDLVRVIPNAEFCPTFSEMAEKIGAVAGQGDIVLTVGAGDIYKVGEALVNRF